MFHLRAYVSSDQVQDVSRALHELAGVRHIVLSRVTADDAITDLTALGVGAEDLSIARVEVVRPMTPVYAPDKLADFQEFVDGLKTQETTD